MAEAATALALAWMAWAVGLSWFLPPTYLSFVGVGLSLALIDFDTKKIPNRVLVPGLGVGVILLAVEASVFKMISLAPPNDNFLESDPLENGYGMFLFGNNAFGLTVGRQILE